MAHIAEPIVQPVEPLGNPAAGRLNRGHPQARETLKHAVIDHGGEGHAGVLNDIHAEEHKAGITVAIPFVANVFCMDHQVQSDGNVALLGRCPDGVKVRMAKTFAIYGQGANKDPVHSGFGQALNLLDRSGRVAQRNMAQGIETIHMPLTGFNRPTVIGAAVGGGELRVFNQVLPQQPQGGVDKLACYPFDIEESETLLHVLKRVTERLGRIEGLEPLARFFLAIAYGNTQEFFDAEISRMIDPKIFNGNRILVVFGILFKPQAARAILWVDILLPQVKWFHKMAVRINNTRHVVSPLSVSDLSHCRHKLFHLSKEFSRLVRCCQHI